MKAMVCTKYGSPDVLELRNVQKPIPKDNEILVKVRASTVATGDIRVRSFKSPFLLWLPMRLVLGIRRPRKRILGVDLAGEIEAVGKDASRFKKGDQIYALTGMRFGAHAEYTCLREDSFVALKPTNMSFEEATAIPFGGTTAIHFFRKGNIQSGDKVVVYGASGAVGTAAIQLAKYFGAEVTAICSSANFELVKSLGADHTIDYTKEDFTQSNKRYDIIFDAVGKTSKSKSKKALAPNGVYLSVAGQGIAQVRSEDLIFLKELAEMGKIKSVIDRRYMLEQIPEAHRYVEKGHKKGNVVIMVGQQNEV